MGVTNCVSQKKYTALQTQYTDAACARDQLQVEKTASQQKKNRNEEALHTSLLSKNQQVNQLNANLSGAQHKNSQLPASLRGKEQRIADMQRILAQKDAAVKILRQKAGDALRGFDCAADHGNYPDTNPDRFTSPAVTPSGQAEYVPVATNNSPADKALNRRTGIILTPKLDELFQIPEQN